MEKFLRLVIRTKNLISFLRGDFIVLMPQGKTLVVDPGNNTKTSVQSAAEVFFDAAVKLG